MATTLRAMVEDRAEALLKLAIAGDEQARKDRWVLVGILLKADNKCFNCHAPGFKVHDGLLRCVECSYELDAAAADVEPYSPAEDEERFAPYMED